MHILLASIVVLLTAVLLGSAGIWTALRSKAAPMSTDALASALVQSSLVRMSTVVWGVFLGMWLFAASAGLLGFIYEAVRAALR